MSDDQQAAATKGDIRMLKDDIQMIMEQLGKMYDAQERWKTELKEHFDLVAENIRHDFASANREEIDVLKDGHKGHEKRILTLERAAGLAAR